MKKTARKRPKGLKRPEKGLKMLERPPEKA